MPKGTKNYVKPYLPKNVKKEVKYEIKKALKSEQEMKWFGSGFAPTAVYSGAGYQQQNMTLISRGSADNERNGDEINIKSININVGMIGPVTSGNSFQHIRCMVFQMKNIDTTPVAPQVNEILLADIATGVRSTYSFRAPDFMSKYTMLYDKVFTVDETDTTSFLSPAHTKFLRIKVPLKYAKKHIRFRGTNTDSDCSLWIAFIGSEPTSATNATVECEYRVLYTDS